MIGPSQKDLKSEQMTKVCDNDGCSYLRDIKGKKQISHVFQSKVQGGTRITQILSQMGAALFEKCTKRGLFESNSEVPFLSEIYIFAFKNRTLLRNLGNLVQIANYNISRTALFKSALLLENCDDCTFSLKHYFIFLFKSE